MPRIAVVDAEKCQPKRCSLECQHYCPSVRGGDETIVFDEQTRRPIISEELCTGCGICSHRCPFKAIFIINLPDVLEGRCIHRYGKNGFALYELPVPRAGSVIGLVGRNGMGKTTSLEILSGRLKPNLGSEGGAEPSSLTEFFRGSELQTYFNTIDRVKAVYKPQKINQLSKAVRGKVADVLKRVDERGVYNELLPLLDLKEIADREMKHLSGGELQRVAIAAAVARDADLYFFDEPSSHLDVYQRLNSAKVIRGLADAGKSVLVVEHDLAVLDYMCDQVHVMYGTPRAYGVVSKLMGVRVGINSFLDGYLREENIRFRREAINFEVRPPSKPQSGRVMCSYSHFEKSLGGFKLHVGGGDIRESEIIGIAGANATGKTTFVKLLAGELRPTSGKVELSLRVSYKPQYPSAEFEGTVESLLHGAVGKFDSTFENEVLIPLGVDLLLEKEVRELSGGELQRVAIAACLGKPADLYLLDEPSAYLDVEQRLMTAKVIKRVVEKKNTAGLVVDHDLLTLDFISDRMLVFTGKPGKRGETHGPMEMREGMNLFLSEVGVTFRRDPYTGRPRANKPGSRLDQEQKRTGEYFYT